MVLVCSLSEKLIQLSIKKIIIHVTTFIYSEPYKNLGVKNTLKFYFYLVIVPESFHYSFVSDPFIFSPIPFRI